MLRSLRIENLVLIGGADLALAPGLNAITGETGAGKTILAQAIGLLLGARGDAAYVGPAGSDAYVEAEFDLPPGLLEEEAFESLLDLRPEDEEGVVLARRIGSEGRTRAYAWGRSAAREDVAALGERLLEMSGQFEQRRLARPAYQLAVLDSFSGEEQLRRRAEATISLQDRASGEASVVVECRNTGAVLLATLECTLEQGQRGGRRQCDGHEAAGDVLLAGPREHRGPGEQQTGADQDPPELLGSLPQDVAVVRPGRPERQ